MKPLKMIIERSKDLYSIYPELDGDGLILGSGDTIEKAKKSLLTSIEIIKAFTPGNIPEILKGEYEIVYKLDVQSFLVHYKGIFTQAALERLTNINQRQLQHYSSGLKKPRPAQRKRIEDAIHKLGHELLSLHF